MVTIKMDYIASNGTLYKANDTMCKLLDEIYTVSRHPDYIPTIPDEVTNIQVVRPGLEEDSEELVDASFLGALLGEAERISESFRSSGGADLGDYEELLLHSTNLLRLMKAHLDKHPEVTVDEVTRLLFSYQAWEQKVVSRESKEFELIEALQDVLLSVDLPADDRTAYAALSTCSFKLVDSLHAKGYDFNAFKDVRCPGLTAAGLVLASASPALGTLRPKNLLNKLSGYGLNLTQLGRYGATLSEVAAKLDSPLKGFVGALSSVDKMEKALKDVETVDVFDESFVI